MENTAAGKDSQTVTVKVINHLGIHLRPASQIVKLASQYEDCEVFLTKDGQEVNAKSIMGVVMLAAEQGSELLLKVVGPSASAVIDGIVKLFEEGFGEEIEPDEATLEHSD